MSKAGQDPDERGQMMSEENGDNLMQIDGVERLVHLG